MLSDRNNVLKTVNSFQQQNPFYVWFEGGANPEELVEPGPDGTPVAIGGKVPGHPYKITSIDSAGRGIYIDPMALDVPANTLI